MRLVWCESSLPWWTLSVLILQVGCSAPSAPVSRVLPLDDLAPTSKVAPVAPSGTGTTGATTLPTTSTPLTNSNGTIAPGVPSGTSGIISTSPGLLKPGDPIGKDQNTQLVDSGGIVFVAQRALLRDVMDGYKLVANNSAAYRVMFTLSDVPELQTGQDPTTGRFFYQAIGPQPPNNQPGVIFVESRSPNRAVGKNVDVPDESIISVKRIIFESREPNPPGYPAGTELVRQGVEILADEAPLRGSYALEQVVRSGEQVRPDKPIPILSELEFSRDLRFKVPIPFLKDKPMIYKRFSTDFFFVPNGKIEARVVDEQRIWPDGQVLQQVITREPEKGKERQKGTMILPDKNRTPVNFERDIDYAQEKVVSTTRTLAGISIVAQYSRGVFKEGEIKETASGKGVATLKPLSLNKIQLTYPTGTTESVSLDDTSLIALESQAATASVPAGKP